VDVPPGRGLVLLVEDEPPVADLVRRYLTRHGFGVHVEHNGHAALSAVGRMRPVACVLDVELPGLSGTDVCRRMRTAGDWTPVLFVTAHTDEADRIVGLELGADDYVTKPFSPRELVARVDAVLRRSSGSPGRPATRRLGPLTADRTTRTIHVGATLIPLTPMEFDLLFHLLGHPGRVFSRPELLAAVWGYSAHAGTRTVDVHVGQLRTKLGPDALLIRTVWGVGYTVQDTT
jgi:DNA-binding response OmpR family regulator